MNIIKLIRQLTHPCNNYCLSTKYLGRHKRRLFYSCPVCGCIRVDVFMGSKDWGKYPENNGADLDNKYEMGILSGMVFKRFPSYLLGIGDYDHPVNMTSGKFENW